MGSIILQTQSDNIVFKTITMHIVIVLRIKSKHYHNNNSIQLYFQKFHMLYKIFSNILHFHNVIFRHLHVTLFIRIEMLNAQYASIIYIGTHLQIMFIRQIIRRHLRVRRSCFVLYLIIKSNTYRDIYTIIQNILF